MREVEIIWKLIYLISLSLFVNRVDAKLGLNNNNNNNNNNKEKKKNDKTTLTPRLY